MNIIGLPFQVASLDSHAYCIRVMSVQEVAETRSDHVIHATAGFWNTREPTLKA